MLRCDFAEKKTFSIMSDVRYLNAIASKGRFICIEKHDIIEALLKSMTFNIILVKFCFLRCLISLKLVRFLSLWSLVLVKELFLSFPQTVGCL